MNVKVCEAHSKPQATSSMRHWLRMYTVFHVWCNESLCSRRPMRLLPPRAQPLSVRHLIFRYEQNCSNSFATFSLRMLRERRVRDAK